MGGFEYLVRAKGRVPKKIQPFDYPLFSLSDDHLYNLMVASNWYQLYVMQCTLFKNVNL